MVKDSKDKVVGTAAIPPPLPNEVLKLTTA